MNDSKRKILQYLVELPGCRMGQMMGGMGGAPGAPGGEGGQAPASMESLLQVGG